MRYVVTGGSGYIGSRLVKALGERSDTERVFIADLRPPRVFPSEVDYMTLDVRDAGRLQAAFEREKADVLIHLAGVLDGEREVMYETNVAGTNNVLDAAAKAGIRHVVAVSSVAAYGPRKKNGGRPVDEEVSLAATQEFEYGKHAATADRLCQLWAARHNDRTMTLLRPALVLGPTVDNSISRLWTQPPFHARFADPGDLVQVVHEDDFAEALLGLAVSGSGGVFNVAGEGTVSVGECHEVTGLKRPRVPRGLYSKVAGRGPALRALGFIERQAIVSTDRLRARTGWFPAHTSRTAFEAATASRSA